MAKTDQPGILEQHAEKIAVAVAAIVLIAVLALWVVKSPHVTDEVGRGSDPIQPGEMDARLADAAIRARDIIERRAPTIEPVQDATGGLANAIRNRPPRAFVPFTEGPPARELGEGPLGNKQVTEMPAIPPLTQAKVWIGHELVQKGGPTGFGVSSEDVTVAHVTAVLEYGNMVDAWKKTLDGTGTLLDVRFARLVAERQERMGDGSWGNTEEVRSVRANPATGSVGLPEVLAFDGTNLQAARAAHGLLGGAGVQEAIVQPAYYQVYWPESRMFAGWMHHLPRTRVSDLETATVRPGQQQPAPYMVDTTVALATPTRATRGPGPVGPGTGMGGMGMGGMGMGGMGMGGMGMGGMGTGAAYGDSEVYGTGAAAGGTGRRTQTPVRRRDTGEQARDAAAKAIDNAIAALDEGEMLLAKGQLRDAESKFRVAERLLRQAESQVPGMLSIDQHLNRIKTLLARLDMPQVTPVPLLGEMCQGRFVQVWVHDDSLKAGAVYRYRLRLELYNPLFINANLTKPESAPPVTVATVSDWTGAAAVPNRNEFFITGTPSSTGQVKVTVFRQTHGQVLTQKVDAGIGDAIGTTEPRSYIDPGTSRRAMSDIDVDFDTGYVIVDLDPDKRIAPRGMSNSTVQVTLLGADGMLVTRTLADDRKHPRYRELLKASKEAEQRLDQDGYGGG